MIDQYSETLLGGREGCVPSLNFRCDRFVYSGAGHVPVGFKPLLCRLSPFHLAFCRWFKAMSLVGIFPLHGLVT